MARPDPAVELRVVAERRERRPPSGDDRPRLRLVVTRGRLGAELEEPFAIAPLSVTELALSFPDVAFPVELTGGIDAFRHRRGRLEQLAVTFEASQVARWAGPRLERVIGEPLVHHLVAPLEDGWLVGLATERWALAFDVVCAPLGGDLRLVPVEPRGLGLEEPAQKLALRALLGLLRPIAEPVGGVAVVRQAARALARELFPLTGMRVPSARDLVLSGVAFEVGRVTLEAAREREPWLFGERAVRAVEAATLLAEAEAALFAGRPDDARRGYLEALGRAPRHPEVSRRLAELDHAVGGREAAALATLSDAMAPTDAGALGGMILAAHGDRDAARVALRRAGEREPYGPLAARCLLELSALESEPIDRAALLDRAVARAPMLADLRWARFEARLEAGRVEEARQDVEHLEAAASGAGARHEVLRRAAGHLLERRHLEEAARSYERSLRYVPDAVEALAGLARALSLVDRRPRALELLSRAVGLAQRQGRPGDGLRLDLARALVEIADDRPAAIAHLRSVTASSAVIFEVRALEARWCAEIGDLAGAGAALARLLEAVEQNLAALLDAPAASDPAGFERRAAVAARLLEGARIHELDRHDLAQAHRMLALALRLAPRHHAIREAFRRLAQSVETPMSPRAAPAAADTARASVAGDRHRAAQRPSRGEARRTDVPMPLVADAGGAEPRPQEAPFSAGGEPLTGAPEDEADDELLAESLTERVRADPTDETSAERLAEVLERLGRDHELLALLSGRIDDMGPTEPLIARRRRVLARLEERARAEGRLEEAALYALMGGQ